MTLIPHGKTSLALREYQIEAIDRTLAAAKRGVRKQLGVAATGLGKTIVFASLARQMQCRTLVLAHRDELVSQAVDKIQGQWPEAHVGVVKAAQNEVGADVVVASVQTLARSNRLGQLLLGSLEPFGLVIVDEAHHARAETYQEILRVLGAGEVGGPLLLGVTATPDRGDGKGLDDVFQEVTWTYDILWGIRSGFLCDVRGRRVTIDTLDLKGVRVRQGDYAEGEVGDRMMDAGAPEAIARAWMEHASDRRTLVFCPTVETAEATAAELVALGVPAGMVSAKTPLEERRQLLRDFSTGRVQVVCNCMVLTEGFDEPRVDCVVVARPTKSRALYTQMVGRGTRRHPDKADLLVLDVVGVSDVHSLVTIPSLFGVEQREFERKLATGEGLVTEVLDEIEEVLVRQGKLKAAEADLFKKMRSTIVWVQAHVDGSPLRRYERATGRDRDGTQRPTVRLTQLHPNADRWACALAISTQGGTEIKSLISDVPLETAQGVGEDWLRKSGSMALVAADAPWRAGAPSPKQLELAQKLGILGAAEMTKGEVSNAIDEKMAQKRATGGGRGYRRR
jgi:ATP-dependent helicase IRC3